MAQSDSYTVPFSYEDLPLGSPGHQIRLIRILPALAIADQVSCEIFRAALDDRPPYEALSYVWGDPETTLPIQVGDRQFNVTTNLDCALRYIRLPDRERIIWVDAICINQQDLSEKGSQVEMMREIYTSALQILVWLGEEGNAKVALNFLDILDRVKGHALRDTAVFRDDAGWDACHSLFYERSWWWRTWILQEVIHQQPVLVYIGTITVALDSLCAKWRSYSILKNHRNRLLVDAGVRTGKKLKRYHSSWTPTLRKQLQTMLGVTHNTKLFHKFLNNAGILVAGHLAVEPAAVIAQERELHISGGKHGNLISLLLEARKHVATDPRDKVYALLGMARNLQELSLRVDYTLSVRSTYIATTRSLLQKYLDVLLTIESPDRPVAIYNKLPSWVPDFTTSLDAVAFNKAVLSGQFQAAPPKLPTLRFSDDGNILILKAVYVAVVTHTRLVRLDINSSENISNQINQIRYDRNPSQRHKPRKKTSQTRSQEETVDFLSSNWGPLWAEVGDIIVVAKGSRIPMVLRKIDEYYIFVGGCWLIDKELGKDYQKAPIDPGFSSIMSGSAWDEVGKTSQEEEFPIK